MKTRNHSLSIVTLGCTGLFLIVALFVLSTRSSAADAGPGNWVLTGKWTFSQSNKIIARFNLQQNQSHVTGTASYHRSTPPDKSLIGGRFGAELEEKGTVEGTVNGTQCELRVKWGYGESGVYKGTISSDGKLTGSAYIAQDPNNAARKCTWSSVYGEARWSKILQ